MESQSQKPQSSPQSSPQAQPAQPTGAAGKAPGKGPGLPENVGTEPISGLNSLNSLDSPEQALGEVKRFGELNSQTGAAGKAYAGSNDEPTSGSSGQKGATPEWQSSLQTTLQQGWTSLTKRVQTVSPTQLALGAAVVGAAVWLGTRKRGAKATKGQQQSSADRWSDYPSGSDGSRSDSEFGRYDSQRQGSRVVRQSGDLPTGSQNTSGSASGSHGQSGESWQRPTNERWDD